MKILIIGSSNTDMIAEVPHIPLPGETVLGGCYRTCNGGKGANQAVAAARQGAETFFICAVGDDALGIAAVESYKKECINTDYIVTKKSVHSGVALIFIDEKGENSIGVAQGANSLLSAEDIDLTEDCFKQTDIVLLQLEVPIETVIYSAKKAKKYGKMVILNPAPMTKSGLPKELLENIDIITPNETELKIMQENTKKNLFDIGIQNLVVTMGKAGADLIDSKSTFHINAYKVSSVDTVGDGDCFNGVLSVALAKGLDIKKACNYAAAAAALATTKKGAQTAMPTAKETTDFISSQKE